MKLALDLAVRAGEGRCGVAFIPGWRVVLWAMLVIAPVLVAQQPRPPLVRSRDPFGGSLQGLELLPPIVFDGSGVRAGPVAVTSTAQIVTVRWPDETKRLWTAEFSLDPKAALIRAISVDGAAVLTQAQPHYRCSVGKRRGGWDQFFDSPEGHPDGTRTFHGQFLPKTARATTIGNRVELSFDGLRLGIFEGSLRFVFFPHSRLIEQAAVVSTGEPDTAYTYDAGLSLFVQGDEGEPTTRKPPRISYYDTRGVVRDAADDPIPIGGRRNTLTVRHRAIAGRTGSGSVAVFPAPHRYFFPRNTTTNMGYVWHSWQYPRTHLVSLGIQQHAEDASGAYPWSNAPPGTEQRLSLFLIVQSGDPPAALKDVARLTNFDRYPALEGYKTLTTHWHFAYTIEALEKGLDWMPPFKPVLEAMGVNAVMLMDFHGDGHAKDLGEIRLRELQAYHDVCRKQSGPHFLLIPAEEANVHFGGHWGLSFPKLVQWRMSRPTSKPFLETDPKHGLVYNVGDASELLELMRRENGFAYQTHPRVKGSTGYPDRIRDTAHFQDERYFGAGWKALPSDLSSPRLGERVFTLLDDMSNWGLRKQVLGEVDVFKIDPTHELWAHMNINYVKMPALPSYENYGQILDALRRGEFFISTGEVLLPDLKIVDERKGRISVRARIVHHFPLQMAELVWGDGKQTHRKQVDLTETLPFGDFHFSTDVEAGVWTWARFAVWDVAANGAFNNPVWRNQ